MSLKLFSFPLFLCALFLLFTATGIRAQGPGDDGSGTVSGPTVAGPGSGNGTSPPHDGSCMDGDRSDGSCVHQPSDDGNATIAGPGNGTGTAPPEALPDFFPDSDYLQSTLYIDYVDAATDPCLTNEGCITGNGMCFM